MKYAIIECGGKQYRAVEGATIEVDLLPLEVGSTLEIEQVLLVADNGSVAIGTPTVDGATVTVVVAKHIKGPKIIVFKYKAKERIRRKRGHRQKYTLLTIDTIHHG